MPESENDHSNFRIHSLSSPTGTSAVIKTGIYKSSLFIFHRELYSILSDLFLDQLNFIWIPKVSFSQNISISQTSHHQR